MKVRLPLLLAASWLLLIIGVSSAGIQARAATLEDFMRRRGYTVVPLKRTVSNELLADATINGKKAKAFLDTGADANRLNDPSRFAAEKLATVDRRAATAYSIVDEHGALVEVKELQLGDIIFEAERAISSNLGKEVKVARAGSLIPGSAPVARNWDILLGSDFLNKSSAVIDCRTPRLYLRKEAPSEQLSSNILESLKNSGYQAIPILGEPRGIMFIRAQANHLPTILMVDTGACVSGFDRKQLKALNLKERSIIGQIYDSAAHPGDIGFGVLESLGLGGLELSHVIVGVGKLDGVNAKLAERKLDPIQALLGAELLSRLSGTIDRHSRILYVKE